MNVADLSLCQELYELSGWEDTYLRHWVNAKSGTAIDHSVAVFGYGKREDSGIEVYPAYDLGYLLRKLPVEVTLTKFLSADGVERYQVNHHAPNKLFNLIMDTPEDAVARLCCELIKQGVL